VFHLVSDDLQFLLPAKSLPFLPFRISVLLFLF
jgi:hypothetical protein